MAHHKSAIKRIKVGERNRQRNRYNLSTMRTSLKKVLLTTSKEEGLQKYQDAASVLDKLVQKGVIHRNTAANKKSSLMRHVNSLN